MAKYILVYEIKDYPDMGGGINVEYPENEQLMHKRVEELSSQLEEKFHLHDAGFLQKEFEYKPIKYAIKLEPHSKK